MSKADELLIDEKWLVEQGISKKALATFKRKFLKGITSVSVSEVLRACEKLKLEVCARWLIDHLPYNPTVRFINHYTGGYIFHDGDIIFNCDVILTNKNSILATGKIIVLGELLLEQYAFVIGRKITATRVAGFNYSGIKGPVETKEASLSDCANIEGDIEAVRVILCRDASIVGDIDTSYLSICDSTYTSGYVKTILLYMSGFAGIDGNVETKIFDISDDARVFGKVDAVLINGVLVNGGKPKLKAKRRRTSNKPTTTN